MYCIFNNRFLFLKPISLLLKCLIRLSFLLIFLPLYSSAQGEHSYIDSLWRVYTTSQNLSKTEELEILKSITQKSTFSLPHNNSMKYAEEYLEKATLYDTPSYLADAYLQKGVSVYLAGDLDSAYMYYEKSLRIAEEMNDSNMIIINWSNKALIHNEKGEYERAINFHEKRLAYMHQHKEEYVQKIAVTYKNLANVYWSMGDYIKSYNHTMLGLDFANDFQEQVKPNTLGRLHQQKARVLKEIENFDEAEEELFKALLITEDSSYARAATHRELAMLAMQKDDDFKVVEFQLNQAIAISEKWNSPTEYVSDLITRAKYYLSKNYTDKAYTDILLAHGLSERHNLITDQVVILGLLAEVSLINKEFTKTIDYCIRSNKLNQGVNKEIEAANANRLALVYAHLGDYKKAYGYSQAFNKLQQQALDKEKISDIAKSETKLKYEELNKALELENSKALNDYKNQKVISLIFGLSFFIVGGFLLSISILYKKLKESNRNVEVRNNIITQKNDELREKNKLLDNSTRQLEAELKSKLLDITHGNELITNTLESINKTEDINKIKKELKRLKNEFNRDNMVEQVDVQFMMINEDYIKKLSHKHPDLTTNNIKLCILIKMGLSAKEIANLLFKTPESIKMAMTRLKRKLKLDKEEKLFNYLVAV